MIKFLKKLFSKKSPLMTINNKTNDKVLAKQLGGNYCQD